MPVDRKQRLVGALALSAALLCVGGKADAQPAEAFYSAKPQLRMLVSSTPGGGYDFFARLVARFFTKYLPGNPSFVVQNMPGGGGVTAANFLYNVAPKDGTTLLLVDRALPTASLLYGKDSATQFDATKFLWLGSMSSEIGVGLVSTKAPAQNIDEMKAKEITFGANGLETDVAMYARLMNTLLGTKIKSVIGYPGQTEYYLAYERGETDGLFMSGWSGPNRTQALRDVGAGKLKYFVQMSSTKHPDLGDTPLILDLIKDPTDRQVVEILLSRLTLGRPFIMPPGVPEDRLAAMRKAFRASAADPELIADAEKAGNRVDPVWGEDAQKIIEKLYATPENVLQRMQSIIRIAK